MLRLTWITVSHDDEPSDDSWRRLKVPAIAALFDMKGTIQAESLPSTIAGMHLPKEVAESASKSTGIVNFRNVWRNSSRSWCVRNRDAIVEILSDAYVLPSNDQTRFELAVRIEAMKWIPSPNQGSPVKSSTALTPLIACLDPLMRFPIINGRDGVKVLLKKLGIPNGDLAQQTESLVGLIGHFGIEDAFIIDTLAKQIAEHIPKLLPTERATTGNAEGTEVPYFDDDERVATTNSRTIIYRNLHRTMIEALRKLFQGYQFDQGKSSFCRYDYRVKNYDHKGRDLLIEAKPESSRGDIRLAIGQLLDYRRHLANRLATDMAVLTITRPPGEYINLLAELQISSLWFQDEKCLSLEGVGKSWSVVEKAIGG